MSEENINYTVVNECVCLVVSIIKQ